MTDSKTTMVIAETNSYRLKISKWKSISPEDLNCIELIEETMDEDGVVVYTNKNRYNLSDNELKTLSVALNKLSEKV